jgi:hypothetical protein
MRGVTYSLEHDGLDVQRLSPGTRGIVLRVRVVDALVGLMVSASGPAGDGLGALARRVTEVLGQPPAPPRKGRAMVRW